MKVLIVGGNGYIGSILRPALEAEHDCRCFDIKQGDWPAERTVVGDVHDDDAVRTAVKDMDAVLYLAMGARRDRLFTQHIDLAFSVNLAGAAHYPKATILVLRLMRPRNETDYQDLHHQPEIRSLCPLGPGDVRRLFLAALLRAATSSRPAATSKTGGFPTPASPNCSGGVRVATS